MKKKNTELLSFIPVSLRETLGQQTVNDLKGIAKWLELSLNARLRKGEIVDCLYHYFLDDPVLWLRRLPLHDIRLLRSLVASGKNCSVEVYNFFGISTLEDLFLVDGDFSVQEDLKMQFVISNELQQALQGIDWDCILSDPGQIRKYEVERYMYGLLNLFGLLRLEDILATVYELLDHKISVEEILDIFEKSLGHPATFFRRNLFEKYAYNESLKIVSDWEFLFRKIVMERCRVKHIPIFISTFMTDGISCTMSELCQKERQETLYRLLSPAITEELRMLYALKKNHEPFSLLDSHPHTRRRVLKFMKLLFALHPKRRH